MISDFKNFSNKAAKRYYLGYTKKMDYNSEKFSYCNSALDYFKQLKSKKIYFDFESINIATRIIDNTLPFMQIVNQMSIIIDDGYGIENKICKNIIIDPLHITKHFFKIIVDELLNIPNPDEYSYVVYNKNFECSRLNEMKYLINENEYFDKIDSILKNIYDLADFFNAEKKTYIFNEKLKGFYSIKKILPMIEFEAQYILSSINCFNYNKLEIKNGSDAQNLSAKRFFKLINDEQ
jgi:hypothetical protein